MLPGNKIQEQLSVWFFISQPFNQSIVFTLYIPLPPCLPLISHSTCLPINLLVTCHIPFSLSPFCGKARYFFYINTPVNVLVYDTEQPCCSLCTICIEIFIWSCDLRGVHFQWGLIAFVSSAANTNWHVALLWFIYIWGIKEVDAFCVAFINWVFDIKCYINYINY